MKSVPEAGDKHEFQESLAHEIIMMTSAVAVSMRHGYAPFDFASRRLGLPSYLCGFVLPLSATGGLAATWVRAGLDRVSLVTRRAGVGDTHAAAANEKRVSSATAGLVKVPTCIGTSLWEDG